MPFEVSAYLLMLTQKGVLTERNPKGIVRSNPGHMEKPEEQSESEINLDKVRAAKQRSREHEVGYQTGQSLGKHLRSSHLLMLPVQMALAPVLLTLSGWWLDRRLGTSPGFTLGGLVFGLAVAVLSLLRSIKEVQD